MQSRSRPLVQSVVLAGIGAILLACGGTPAPPRRGVLEHNIESWKFRRYQEILDVEVWVAKNQSTGYTASYVRGAADKTGQLGDGDVVNAFVTRYQRDQGVLRGLVKFVRRLAQDSGYKVDERKIGGARVITVDGNNEAWALWAARRHVVKIGGRGVESVPESLIEAYADRYPSRVRSGVLEGPLPEADDTGVDPAAGEEEYDPDNPTPDWQKFKAGEVEKSIPASKRGKKPSRK